MRYRNAYLCTLILWSFAAYAENDVADVANNPSRAERKFGISGSLGGPGHIYTLAADYYLTPNFNIECGGSAYGAVFENSKYLVMPHAGIRYAILGHQPRQRWSPYVAAMLRIPVYGGDVSFYNGANQYSESFNVVGISGYFAAGMELVAYDGFTFGFEAAYSTGIGRSSNFESAKGDTGVSFLNIKANPTLALRWGYHFR